MTVIENILTNSAHHLYPDLARSIYWYDIHHEEWELKNVHVDQLEIEYKIGNISFIAD